MNIKGKYKYMPKDFEKNSVLTADLWTFYNLYEKNKYEPDDMTEFNLRFFWNEDMFYTMKHCKQMGWYDRDLCDEISDYLEELIYGD